VTEPAGPVFWAVSDVEIFFLNIFISIYYLYREVSL
jgi:hypothetical protein